MNVLLFVSLFITCWVLGMITWIRIVILNKKIKTELAQKAPTITYSMGLGIKTNSVSEVTTAGINLFKVIFSFGAIQNTRNFVNGFADIKKIEQLADIHLQSRFEKLIRLFSFYFKIWFIGFISIIIGFLLWPSN